MVYTQSRILFRLTRKEILTHATTWINLEDIMLRGIIQSQKDLENKSIKTESGMAVTYRGAEGRREWRVSV